METNTKKDERYYIAYGSNLSMREMARRCPDARVLGTVMLEGWQLVMSRYATIVPNPSMKTPVLIWAISERDERSPDCYEGFPTLYYKKSLNVGGARWRARSWKAGRQKAGSQWNWKPWSTS